MPNRQIKRWRLGVYYSRSWYAGMGIRACRSRVNMARTRSAGQILLVLTLCSSCAIDAYGWSSVSFLHPSIRREEAMCFVAWVVLGLRVGTEVAVTDEFSTGWNNGLLSEKCKRLSSPMNSRTCSLERIFVARVRDPALVDE